jgi:hypothetical protein
MYRVFDLILAVAMLAMGVVGVLFVFHVLPTHGGLSATLTGVGILATSGLGMLLVVSLLRNDRR